MKFEISGLNQPRTNPVIARAEKLLGELPIGNLITVEKLAESLGIANYTAGSHVTRYIRPKFKARLLGTNRLLYGHPKTIQEYLKQNATH